MSEPYQGTCLCKNVKFQVTGEPFHYVLCHCNNCRKSSGSAFMSHSFWKLDQLKITEGESSIRAYEDKNTDSGSTLTRSFCTNCGSSLFVKPENDFILIQPSAIEGSHAWVPKKEAYPQRRSEWLKDITFVTKRSPL